jgi:hypothetical protein
VTPLASRSAARQEPAILQQCMRLGRAFTLEINNV